MTDHLTPLERARNRRSFGIVDDFDGDRLALARRRQRMQRTELARLVGVTATAITQFERNRSRPTVPLANAMALTLGVPAEFLRHGLEIAPVAASAAHFRSLRSTPALSREQALAFAEISLAVVAAFEQYVQFPPVRLPTLQVEGEMVSDQIKEIARETRLHLGLAPGPVNHVIRTLEAAGAVVLTLPIGPGVDARVDAFSTDAGPRPLILLSPEKNDRARSRFDAAHELGHLVMHPDVEPGSKLVEEQAQTFASQFLAPDDELLPDLPRVLDWEALLAAKQKWRISLAALAYRARRLGVWSDSTYLRAAKRLATDGYPERGSLGPRELPSTLGKAVELLAGVSFGVDDLAREFRLPIEMVQQVVESGSSARLSLI